MALGLRARAAAAAAAAALLFLAAARPAAARTSETVLARDDRPLVLITSPFK